MARLRIEFRGATTVVSLKERETTVGRSNRCTINLPDPGLAPIHFRIRQKSKGYQLKDDGSGIGTLVNGKPVYATTLHHGDYISAGGLRCHFLVDAEEPAAAPPPADIPVAPPAPPPRRDHTGVLVWSCLGAVVVLAAVFLLLRGSPEKEAQTLWRQATRAMDDSRVVPAEAVPHLERTVALLERIGSEYGDTRVAGTAASALGETRRILDALARLEDEARTAAGDLTEDEAQDAFARLARIREAAHPAVDEGATAVGEELKQNRVRRYERQLSAAEERAAAFMSDKRFGDALRLWREFEVPDYLYRKRAQGRLEEVTRKVASDYRGLLRLAGRSPELDGRIGLLEASRDVFRGTPHAEDLEVRISALRARRTQSPVVILDDPKKEEPTAKQPEATASSPAEPAEYTEPPTVTALVKGRRYAEAASMLHGISRHPSAKVRIEELTLLANLMADLVGAIQAGPADFTGVLLPNRVGRGNATGADPRVLKIEKDGAATQFAWDAFPARAFVKLFRQAGFHKPSRLAVAVFFDEEGLDKYAEQGYVTFFNSEQTPATLTRVLARRRGIEPPATGFVVFRNRVVAPSEKARVLLQERIAKLAKQARTTKNEKRRRGAWAELEQIGEPALETYRLVLDERRREVATTLGKSKAFSPQRFVVKFGKELQQRRRDALAFILDANKYPYPNKTDAAQKEVERLVDRVRDLYEKPYWRLLEKSEEAQALDNELKELDAKLAGLDPLSEPQRDTVVESIQRNLEMRLVATDSQDKKRIDYNLSVVKYNRDLKTSADREERANVTAVNEYRWMMGQHAVKIDERLLRAARKHSIEMRQLNYFAHDSPTPHLKSPGQRAKREGYTGGIAENIARGAANGVQAFWQWYKSSGHHRNMLNPGHAEMGCGSAAHHWWTQKFGRATGRRLDPPKVPPDPDPPGESGNGKPAPGTEEE